MARLYTPAASRASVQVFGWGWLRWVRASRRCSRKSGFGNGIPSCCHHKAVTAGAVFDMDGGRGIMSGRANDLFIHCIA